MDDAQNREVVSRTAHPGDFSRMDNVNVRIDDQVKDVLAGKKSLGEVSPLVKIALC